MGIITRMRKQDAVYWPYASINQFGEKTVGDPVAIIVRWEDKSEEFLDIDGQIQMSNAVVYVDRDMVVGSILMLGVIADITDSTNIKENDGAWEIRRFDKFPNLKVTEFLRTAYL